MTELLHGVESYLCEQKEKFLESVDDPQLKKILKGIWRANLAGEHVYIVSPSCQKYDAELKAIGFKTNLEETFGESIYVIRWTDATGK